MDKDKEEKVGALPDGPGSREPSPSVSAASGFDPSRLESLLSGSLGSGIKRDWDDLDLTDAETAWAAVHYRFSKEARRHGGMADRLRRDAADALEQAVVHQRRADDYRALADAIERVPVTFPSSDSDRSGEAGETRSGSTVGESAGPQGHRPSLSTERTPHAL